jgi:hypothetical protein
MDNILSRTKNVFLNKNKVFVEAQDILGNNVLVGLFQQRKFG